MTYLFGRVDRKPDDIIDFKATGQVTELPPIKNGVIKSPGGSELIINPESFTVEKHGLKAMSLQGPKEEHFYTEVMSPAEAAQAGMLDLVIATNTAYVDVTVPYLLASMKAHGFPLDRVFVVLSQVPTRENGEVTTIHGCKAVKTSMRAWEYSAMSAVASWPEHFSDAPYAFILHDTTECHPSFWDRIHRFFPVDGDLDMIVRDGFCSFTTFQKGFLHRTRSYWRRLNGVSKRGGNRVEFGRRYREPGTFKAVLWAPDWRQGQRHGSPHSRARWVYPYEGQGPRVRRQFVNLGFLKYSWAGVTGPTQLNVKEGSEMNESVAAELPAVTFSDYPLPQGISPYRNAGEVDDADLAMVNNLCRARNVRRVVEFGPGRSTELFAALGIEVVSYETSDEWLNKARKRITSPLVSLHKVRTNTRLGGTTDEHYDLAFVDGPKGTEDFSRLVPLVWALKHADTVIMHDGARKGERRSISIIREMMPNIRIDYAGTKRGLWILSHDSQINVDADNLPYADIAEPPPGIESGEIPVFQFWETLPWKGPRHPLYDLADRIFEKRCNAGPFKRYLVDIRHIEAWVGEDAARHGENATRLTNRVVWYRALLLQRFGGIWLDADLILTKPLDWLWSRLGDQGFLCGSQFTDTDPECSEIAARPDSSYLSRWIEIMSAKLQGQYFDPKTAFFWLGRQSMVQAKNEGHEIVQLPHGMARPVQPKNVESFLLKPYDAAAVDEFFDSDDRFSVTWYGHFLLTTKRGKRIAKMTADEILESDTMLGGFMRRAIEAAEG